MPINANGITLEDVIAEKKRREQLKATNQLEQPQTKGLIQDLLNKVSPALATTIAQGARGWQSASGYQPKSEESEYQKLINEQLIKKQFENPEEEALKLENIKSQIKNREVENEAMKNPLPQGLVRVGKQVVNDPNYIKPEEQRKIDEANALKEANVQELRDSAQQSINAIEESKKGAKFFGPLGDLPSKYAPSSFMGLGNYGERANWESNINNLLSKKVVDLIGEMKSLSKTGATGFGQLSEKEGQLLREASTVLNKNLPPDRAIYYLNEMEKLYQKILSGGNVNLPSNQSSELESIEAELASINKQLGQ